MDSKIYSIKNKISIPQDGFNLNNQKNLLRFTDSIRIKIIYNQQSINLIKDKNGQNFGNIINRITQYNYKKRDKNKIKNTYEFYQIIQLNDSQIQETITKLVKSKQILLPSDSLISNWNSNYLHCNSVQFELQIGRNLKVQTYHCPWNQDSKNDSISTLIENEKFIKSKLKLDSVYSQFTDNLPKGKSYSSDGYRIMYIMTKRQYNAWINSKPNREYLKSNRDIIDNYLKSLIKTPNIKENRISCFENYDLTFSQSGKLKNIKVSDYDKPKFTNSLGLRDFLNDKKEISKCKRTISQIFRNSNLSFLKLNSNIRRTISFNLSGNAEITDNTIY